MASEDRERQEKRRPLELFGEVVLDDPEPIQQFSPRTPEEETRGQEVAGDITPAVRESSRQQVERRREQQESAPGLAEGFSRARDAEWIGNLVAQNRQFSPDPDFEMSPEKLLEVTEGLPEDAIDYVGEAQSEKEMQFRAQRYRQDHENEQKLAQMGFTGTALRIGAAMTDPVVWGASAGASAVTGPLGLMGTAANRIGRVQRIVRGGAAGAAGNLGVEAAIKANKPIYDDMNMLYAAGLGFGIGGGLSAISRNPSTQPEAEALRRGGQALQREAEDEARRVTEQIGQQPGDAGAAQTSRVEPISPEEANLDEWVEHADRNESVAPRTAYGRVGGLISSVSRLKSSDNPVSRALGNVMAEDAVGNANRNIEATTPATQRQLREQRKHEVQWMRAWKTNFREFQKDVSGGQWKPFNKGAQEREFSELVSDYVEGVRTDVPASVKAQGEKLREIFEDYRVNLNQPGAYRQEFNRPVEGFGIKEADPNYLPHEFSYEGFNKLVREFGTANVENLFARAIRNAADDITEEAARSAARAYVKTVRQIRVGVGADAGRILGSGDAEQIKQFLRQNTGEMNEADIEDVVDALTARKKGKGTGPKHGKSRTPLDMSTEMDLRFNPETMPQGTRRVSIREFFNRDAHDLFTKYNRRMSGSLAMARTRVPGLFDGVTNSSEWETLKTRIREAGEMKNMTPRQIEDDIEQADYLWRSVMGIPQPGQMSELGQFLRKVRDWNFMRVMGQVGFAQIPEIGVAATGVGLKATMKSVPGFRTLFRNMQDGKIDNKLVDELEMASGFGADWLRMQHVERFDDISNSIDTPVGGKLNRAYENFTREGKRAVFAGSGMGFVNTFAQRFAMTGVANRFADMAFGRSKWLSSQRLRAMGLSDARVEKILENIRKHAEFEDGLAGPKLKQMGLDRWDLDAKADFEEALFGYTRRLIQENDPGQFRPIMSKPVAQTILQFRTFIMGAHTKALLHNIHMRDFQAFSTFATSSLLGALGYMAYTYSNAQGRSDKTAYLQERLTMDKVSKAAFERSSWAALTPTAIDTAGLLAGVDPIFDFRTTGQSTDIIFGNPSSDLLDSATSATSSVVRPIMEGREPSQSEIRSGLRVMPFQNLHGITQMSNLLLGESGLPERPPQ